MNAPDDHPIRIAAIAGSVRPNNYTRMALRVVIDGLSVDDRVQCTLVDPGRMELPLPGMNLNHPDAVHLRSIVSDATGVILATPEYHGSFSSVIKLVIENLGFPSAMAGKPVALLGVAAGSIGAIKSLESLQGVCTHVGAIVLPGPISIARVRTVFDSDGNCTDEGIENRLKGLGANLLDYIGHAVCPSIALEAMVRQEAA